MSGRATLATARLRLATAATRISVARTRPARFGLLDCIERTYPVKSPPGPERMEEMSDRKPEAPRGERILPGVWRLRLALPWPGVPHGNVWVVAADGGV